MVCVPLWVDELRLGTLSLYGEKPDAFAPQHRQLTDLYATHAAIALADAQRTARLHEAMDNRDVIGQAKGILIERLKLTPDAGIRLPVRGIAARQPEDARRRPAPRRHRRTTNGLTSVSRAPTASPSPAPSQPNWADRRGDVDVCAVLANHQNPVLRQPGGDVAGLVHQVSP